MKELEIISDTCIGEPPNEDRSITFRVFSTKKKYTFNHITHGDYIFFRKQFDPESATGWKGYNFLKSKYEEEDNSANTPEEDQKILDGFAEFKRKYNIT